MTKSPASTMPTPPAPESSIPGWIAPALAFVAGAVDTAGFIVLGGIFCAHVTGNFVLLGAMLNAGDHSLLIAKLAVLPIFVAGVAVAWWMTQTRVGRSAATLAAVEAGLLACASAASAIHAGATSESPLWWTQLASAVCAMGWHSVLSRSLRLPMTNVMTGNVTQLTIDLLERRHRTQARAGAIRGVLLVGAFAVGAVFSGLGVGWFGLQMLIVPSGIMLGIAITIGRRGQFAA